MISLRGRFSDNADMSTTLLVRNSGTILFESAPPGMKLSDIRHDIEQVSFPLPQIFPFLIKLRP